MGLATRAKIRRSVRVLILTGALWLVPNNKAAWWHDRAYDVCMATAGDDDWTCEDLLTAAGE